MDGSASMPVNSVLCLSKHVAEADRWQVVHQALNGSNSHKEETTSPLCSSGTLCQWDRVHNCPIQTFRFDQLSSKSHSVHTWLCLESDNAVCALVTWVKRISKSVTLCLHFYGNKHKNNRVFLLLLKLSNPYFLDFISLHFFSPSSDVLCCCVAVFFVLQSQKTESEWKEASYVSQYHSYNQF